MPTPALAVTAPLPQIRKSRILALLGEIGELFESHFDRGLIAHLIDDLPIDFGTLREIRQLTSRSAMYADDVHTLRYGVIELETFTGCLRRFLLPVIKERLGVSPLHGHRAGPHDHGQFAHRKLLAYTFPFNLTRLEELTAQIKQELSEHRGSAA